VRVKIEGDNDPQPTLPREEGQIPFMFVGTIESISNAKVLLEYHLAHLKVSVFSLVGIGGFICLVLGSNFFCSMFFAGRGET
jgi:hypothetical protein